MILTKVVRQALSFITDRAAGPGLRATPSYPGPFTCSHPGLAWVGWEEQRGLGKTYLNHLVTPCPCMTHQGTERREKPADEEGVVWDAVKMLRREEKAGFFGLEICSFRKTLALQDERSFILPLQDHFLCARPGVGAGSVSLSSAPQYSEGSKITNEECSTEGCLDSGMLIFHAQ